MSCIFRASGYDFDIDAFFQISSLIPHRTWRKGEIRRRNRIQAFSGFSLVASEAEMEEPIQQMDDAIEFLKANQQELEKLRQFSGVMEMFLDFGIADRDNVLQCDRFPPELLRLAGNLDIGIEITRY